MNENSISMRLLLGQSPAKDPFRRFNRNSVAILMGELNISGEELTGVSRRTYPANVVDFDTFDTLDDPVAYFAEAMTIELEHGKVAALVGGNVTNDDPKLTAGIAAAHLAGVEYDEGPPHTPFPTYYDWLIWMEGLHSAAVKIKQ